MFTDFVMFSDFSTNLQVKSDLPVWADASPNPTATINKKLLTVEVVFEAKIFLFQLLKSEDLLFSILIFYNVYGL